MNRVFQTAFHIPGTLAANVTIKWTAPFDCQLIHVSAVGSNANGGELTVGDSTDADGYITAFTIGDSGTPVEKEALTDFNGALAGSQYPHISDGDIIALALDYDGDGGTATNDFTVVLTFTEG
jgi:plastocyanin domain-containing protein